MTLYRSSVIDISKTATNAGIPIKVSFNIPDPLVKTGDFKGVEITVVAEAEIAFKPVVGSVEVTLIADFCTKSVSAAKPQADGVFRNFLCLSAQGEQKNKP